MKSKMDNLNVKKMKNPWPHGFFFVTVQNEQSGNVNMLVLTCS